MAADRPAANDVLAGLPDDLVRVLRDQSIIVPQDAAVFDLVAKWANAPSDTASAMTVEDWQAAWSDLWKRYDALLKDALVLMDQTASVEVQKEARLRIIEREGRRPSDV